jgi:hypothetical protein
MVAAALTTSAAQAQWQFGGTFDCVGRDLGNQSVKVNCIQEVERGNRLYTNVANFTIRGTVAKHYIGKHTECWHIPPEETRMNEHVITCPGVPKWW